MDLTTEAEAFGAEIVFSDDAVPAVVGHMLSNVDDIQKLESHGFDKKSSFRNPIIKIKTKKPKKEKYDDTFSEGIVDVIMLDNTSCEMMKEAVEITNGRALLEASGNVTAENIRSVAETGVNIISLGALTHSVKCFDISMKIKKK